MRGNHGVEDAIQPRYGSIPAFAGEPIERPEQSRIVTVYPRVCGGTQSTWSCSISARGLSPRLRGNLDIWRFRVVLFRSIPAFAGEPHLNSKCRVSWTVYPRVCGGTTCSASARACSSGLSPRLRGNRLEYKAVLSATQVYPRVCGEPPLYKTYNIYTQVYPRVCGGTASGRQLRFTANGLSPRLRGNLMPATASNTAVGSIPAFAGEPPNGTFLDLSNPGLSPRLRGNPVLCRPKPDCKRSIPAFAGEPLLLLMLAAWERVYPRVCGGTGKASLHSKSRSGLSPRLRGNRL